MLINRDVYKKYFDIAQKTVPFEYSGAVEEVIGFSIRAQGPAVSRGDLCYIETGDDARLLQAEVVGFDDRSVFLMPLGDMHGLRPGARIYSQHEPLSVKVGDQLMGRVLDGLGNPRDGKGDILTNVRSSVRNTPPDPLKRKRITEPLTTGVRAIDALVTVGRGQRMGIFSGSGVGKSTLMGMIARYTNADVAVIGLVGERGREVREFIEKDLGEEGLKKSVVVVETGDSPAMLRINAAMVATTIAEYFRDQGKDVLLMMDSVTRVAMALREVYLTTGEPPATKGYPPSVFSFLPGLLERSGPAEKGTITGFYTVLVEADDFNEPVSDTVRSILDGHIMLSRHLAHMNHYPAIDVLQSISRVLNDITDEEHKYCIQKIREILASYREAEDLINIGAYVKGSNPRIDVAITKINEVNKFLRQGIAEGPPFSESIRALKDIVSSGN